MAGTVTTTEVTYTSPKKITFDWLSDGAGAADATTTAKFDGVLLLIATVPDGGATAPDVDYDLVLKNADGIDILAAQGLNRSQTLTQFINSGMGALAGETLTLGITNAGAANGGLVYVYLR